MEQKVNRKQLQREDSNARILAAAIKLFGEHGYSHTSLTDIAKEAGVSHTLAVRRFETKEELYYAAYFAAVKRSFPDYENFTTFKEYLTKFVAAARLAREKDPEGFMLAKRVATASDLPDSYERIRTDFFEKSAINEAFKEAQAQGLIMQGDSFTIFHGLIINILFKIDMTYTYGGIIPSCEDLCNKQLVSESKQQKNDDLMVFKNITVIDKNVDDRVYIDGLTGAFNRNFYNDYIDSLETSALAILDMDNLKTINDIYGHLAGDEALKSVVKAINHAIRSDDVVIRYGGDEFVIVFNGIPKDILKLRLDALRRKIAKLALPEYPLVKLSCSIGGIACSKVTKDVIKRADELLYKAKAIKDTVAVDLGEPVRTSEEAAPSPGFYAPVKRTLLVAEDNELNRDILCEVLAEDYNVLEAENGAVALELLQKHITEISLVILDVQMPVMDGYEFLDIVKKYPLLSDVPVIVATGNNNQEEESKCFALGANDFISKPYNFDIMKMRIASIIHLKESAVAMSALKIDERIGLYTFQAFCYYAKQAMECAEDRYYSLTVFDINNFRSINDTYGEEAGNNILKQLAEVVRNYCSSADVYGRYSTDRFLVLHKTMSEEKTEAWMQALLDKLTEVCEIKEITFRACVYKHIEKKLPVAAVCKHAILVMNTVERGRASHYAVYDSDYMKK